MTFLRSPEHIVYLFETTDYDRVSFKEDMMIDMLILGGDRVPDLVADRIIDKNMKWRGYAIFYLGQYGSRRHLDTLEKLLENRYESIQIRGEALRSIWRIDPAKGMNLATDYINDKDGPYSYAEYILVHDDPPNPRTWNDAFWGK